MHFEPGEVYHVYNRGNRAQSVFFDADHYEYFLHKVQNELVKICDVLCYCLMPTHFHFMLMPNEDACKKIWLSGRETRMQQLSKTIGKTLSSYVLALQKQQNFVGNLFQKKTKAKCLTDSSQELCTGFAVKDYLINCLHYIHLNPSEARLVTNLLHWQFSS